MLRPPAQQQSKKPRQPKPISSKRPKLLALQPSDMSRTRGTLRLSPSKGNMATSCGTWRSKSFERRAEVEQTSSLPVRPPCMPAHWSSRVFWLLPTTFYWGRHFHLLHSSCCRGLPQCKNSLLQPFLPQQCPSSLLGPEDGTLHQILWRICLWVEPLWRQLQEDPPAPRDPALGQSTQAELCQGIWPRLWLGKGGQEGILLKTFLQLCHGRHPQSLRDI